MAFSIRLTEDEWMLAESYAESHSCSLSEAFKRALFEKLEDEYDVAVAESAYKEYVDSGHRSNLVQDFWIEMDEEGSCQRSGDGDKVNMQKTRLCGEA